MEGALGFEPRSPGPKPSVLANRTLPQESGPGGLTPRRTAPRKDSSKAGATSIPMESTTGFEPAFTGLQPAASPLGYVPEVLEVAGLSPAFLTKGTVLGRRNSIYAAHARGGRTPGLRRQMLGSGAGALPSELPRYCRAALQNDLYSGSATRTQDDEASQHRGPRASLRVCPREVGCHPLSAVYPQLWSGNGRGDRI
jgi:hypothetical protein